MHWARAVVVAGLVGVVAQELDAQVRRTPPASAAGGGLSGTWEAQSAAGGTVTLVLAQDGPRIRGTLSGNGAQFEVEAQLGDDGGFYGTARGRDGALFIGGELQGGALGLALAEMGENGVPDMRSAQELRMTRSGAAATGSPRSGSVAESPHAPQAGAAPAPGAAAAGNVATTPQDQQVANLLVSSPWCTMQYSQQMGATTTERAVFGRDGRFGIGSQRESAVNNQAGSYYGRSGDAQQGFWRIQGGQLMLSQDGQRYEGTPLQISRNSNGYPIITANGREYYQCN